MLPPLTLRSWLAHSWRIGHEPRPRAGLALLAGLLAVGFLMLAELLPTPTPEAPDAGPVYVSQMQDAGPELVPDTELTDLEADGSIREHGPELPEKPLQGQRRPPCDPEVQVVINGACWIPHEKKPPCGKKMYEHGGRCLLPAGAKTRIPASIEQ